MLPQQSLGVVRHHVAIRGVVLAGGVEVHLVLHELRYGGRALFLPLLLRVRHLLLGRLLLLFGCGNCSTEPS